MKIRLETALKNVESVRAEVKAKLETEYDDLDEDTRTHLINYKLELLDLKLRLEDMIKHIELIH